VKQREGKKHVGNICRVVWNDITGKSGWTDPEQLDRVSQFASCITFGVVVAAKVDGLLIAGSIGSGYDDTPFYGDLTYIPWGCVVSIWDLEAGDDE